LRRSRSWRICTNPEKTLAPVCQGPQSRGDCKGVLGAAHRFLTPCRFSLHGGFCFRHRARQRWGTGGNSHAHSQSAPLIPGMIAGIPS
jgi:hypothetical protein